MKQHPLNNLFIRTAVPLRSGVGYIYCSDPVRDENENPHTVIFKWYNGAFERFESNYNIHSVCVISSPEYGLLNVSEQGYFSLETRSGVIGADIIEGGHPPSKDSRSRGIRSIAEIVGKAYAVGLRGMVYRLDQPPSWTRIDEGLPEDFDIQAIHGFGDTELYAVGRDGQLWQSNGSKWVKRELSTNVNLTCVHCAGNGKVYIGGHNGLLLEGRHNQWKVIENSDSDDIWDIKWFENNIYFSTMTNLFSLKQYKIFPVDFGVDRPNTFYGLSVGDGVMWSVGERDIWSFDGFKWLRVV